ncbi:MAG: NAD(P)H-dependent oxidoreductase [Bacteroidota bacterium]|nr:NAD(P)H-dependent oxidoreductase [Bacteroidota bacterium]
MPKITIIISSVRTGRKSPRVVDYFKNYIETNQLATVEILDLKEYNFPVFDERLQFQKEPTEGMLDFSAKIKGAEGILIVTPEYNGGYPPALKNAIDLLYEEWHRKPVAISTVSSGAFGGSQVITSLQFTLWKMHAWTVPAVFPVSKVGETFSEKGEPSDPTATDKRAKTFIDELLWCMEAGRKMEEE